MQAKVKIAVDLTGPSMGVRVHAIQGDGNTRLVEVTLLSDGRPWQPPVGVEAAIAYCQPDGHTGLYNKLADGTDAISISGNVVTVILAPQILTAPGVVDTMLVFNDAALNRLTTFPFPVFVTSNPASGTQKTEDYIRLQWLEDKLDEYLEKLIGDGIGVGPDAISRLVEKYLKENPPSCGTVEIQTDKTLTYSDGILRVNTTNVAETDNTLPITSAGVNTIVGNIGAILDTI